MLSTPLPRGIPGQEKIMRLAAVVLAVLLVASCVTTPESASVPKKIVLTEFTTAGLKEYQDGIGSTGHGFFAVAVDGADYAYWYCRAIACIETRASNKTRALDDCRERSKGVDCIVLMQDQDAVHEYQTYPIPLPPPSAADAAQQAAAKPVDRASWPAPPPVEQMEKEGHPGWDVDRLHGCWVWNNKPHKGDAVTWTGLCGPEGKATGDGVLEWLSKSRYVGTMKAGKEDGQGRYVNAWGDTYEGGFKEGEQDGRGTYVWSDGARYEGGYKMGYPDGFGTFTERGEVYRGEWKNGCFNDGNKKYRILDNNVPGCSL